MSRPPGRVAGQGGNPQSSEISTPLGQVGNSRAVGATGAYGYFLVSAIFHYLGPAFAVLLFEQVDVLGVAWLRIASAALVFGLWRRPWRLLGPPRPALLAFGCVLAAMNACFYLAIARLPLGTVGAIEFLGTLVLAAVGVRTPRNLVALGLAVTGVYALTDVRFAGEPLGFAFAFANCALFMLYVVLGHRIARDGGSEGIDPPWRGDADRRRGHLAAGPRPRCHGVQLTRTAGRRFRRRRVLFGGAVRDGSTGDGALAAGDVRAAVSAAARHGDRDRSARPAPAANARRARWHSADRVRRRLAPGGACGNRLLVSAEGPNRDRLVVFSGRSHLELVRGICLGLAHPLGRAQWCDQ
jgi:hypothetical protein